MTAKRSTQAVRPRKMSFCGYVLSKQRYLFSHAARHHSRYRYRFAKVAAARKHLRSALTWRSERIVAATWKRYGFDPAAGFRIHAFPSGIDQ